VFSGIVDLAARIEGRWNLVDFKTSRPAEGEGLEDFLQKELDAHRPQMVAYTEIWAKLVNTVPARIDAFIYWTALRENRRVLL
jgi:ATP-dependent exoDNAse (exonuclease V) beta subunit